MYTEELESFEEAEKEAPEPYTTTNYSQQDAEKLARENEKLKKNLEKEKFFNRLLDQELKEVKADAATRVPAEYVHAAAKHRFSAGAFYTVLVIALAMAGFIFYTLYNNKQFNLFGNRDTVTVPVQPTNSDEINNTVEAPAEEAPVTTGPAIAADTVPQIIGTTPAPVTKAVETVKDEPAPATKEPVATVNNNNSTVNNIQEKAPVIKQEIPKTAKPVTEKPAEVAASNTQPATPPVAAPARQVLARYKVSSKANFYSNADENTLRSAYINGGNKTVEALEDKNGFIYVEYVNDNGMMTKGWLSKKDLNPE